MDWLDVLMLIFAIVIGATAIAWWEGRGRGSD